VTGTTAKENIWAQQADTSILLDMARVTKVGMRKLPRGGIVTWIKGKKMCQSLESGNIQDRPDVSVILKWILQKEVSNVDYLVSDQ
jgi:hypothetical protein